jgi:hypothetical protein
MKKCISVVIAILVLNLIAGAYLFQPGWIETDLVGTGIFWHPGTFRTNFKEGMGIYSVDANGYLNKNLPLEDKYTVVLGSSMTQAVNVMEGERYSDLLNTYLQKSSDRLAVYNVSRDNFLYPDIVKGFSALVSQFQDAERFVIEIGTVEFEDYEDSLNQTVYGDLSADEIVNRQSWNAKLKMTVKEFFPLFPVVKGQIENMISLNDGNEQSDEVRTEDTDKVIEYYNKSLQLLRKSYDGEIIIFYHPTVSIAQNGDLNVTQENNLEEFMSICEENEIGFIDMTTAFKNAYANDGVVPYGFSNTQVGIGHLNKYGHKLIADELYKYLEERQ